MGQHSRSPVEKNALNTSSQLEQQGLNNQNAAQGTLSQFEGPVTESPFYKSLLTSGTEATSNAYNNATAKMRAKANQAGFNYTQPAEQGSEAELGNEEAKTLGAIPAQAQQAAANAGLAAAGQTANIGNSQQNTGLGYTNAAVPLENQYQQAQQGFFNTLFNAGAGAVGGFLPGGGGAIQGALANL